MFKREEGVLGFFYMKCVQIAYALNLFLRLIIQIFNESTQTKNSEGIAYVKFIPLLKLEMKLIPMELE